MWGAGREGSGTNCHHARDEDEDDEGGEVDEGALLQVQQLLSVIAGLYDPRRVWYLQLAVSVSKLQVDVLRSCVWGD